MQKGICIASCTALELRAIIKAAGIPVKVTQNQEEIMDIVYKIEVEHKSAYSIKRSCSICELLVDKSTSFLVQRI